MLNKLQVISTTPERNIVSNNASPNSSVILSYTPPRPATPSTCEETRSNTSSSFRSGSSSSSARPETATATTPERAHRYKLPPTTPGSPVKNSNNSNLQCLYTDQSLDYLVQYGVLDRSEAQAMSSTPTAVDQSQSQNNVDILEELTLALDQKLALCDENEANETETNKQQHKRKRVGFLEQRRTNDELLHMFQGWSHQQQQQHKRSHSLEDNETLGSLFTAEEAENAKRDAYESFPNNDHSHSAYSNSVRSSMKPCAASIPSMRIPSMCSYSESEQSSNLFGERALEQQQRTPMSIDHRTTFIPNDNPPAASYRLERTTPRDSNQSSSSNHRYRFGLTSANDSKDYLSFEDTLTGDDISKPKYGESKFDQPSSQSQVPFDERTTTHREEEDDFVHVSKKFLTEAGAVMRRMSNEISKQLSCATRLPEEFEICRNGKQDRTIVTPPPPPLLADDYLHIRDDQETISHLDSKLSYEFGYEYDCSEQPARMQQQQHHIVHPPSSHPHTNGFYPVTRPVVFKAADV